MADVSEKAISEAGQTATHKDPVSAYDAAAGKYHDKAHDLPEDVKLPMKQFPKAPDPNPFTLGPMTPGKRE